MTHPFSRTNQAHLLDRQRPWLALLVVAGALSFAWGAWIAGARVGHARSDSVRLVGRASRAMGIEQRGNVYRAEAWREQRLEARFPAAAGDAVAPGQEATVFVAGAGGEQTVAATVAAVRADGGATVATLHVRTPAAARDPFADAAPTRVEVAGRWIGASGSPALTGGPARRDESPSDHVRR